MSLLSRRPNGYETARNSGENTPTRLGNVMQESVKRLIGDTGGATSPVLQDTGRTMDEWIHQTRCLQCHWSKYPGNVNRFSLHTGIGKRCRAASDMRPSPTLKEVLHREWEALLPTDVRGRPIVLANHKIKATRSTLGFLKGFWEEPKISL